jgi:hypothetical protein
MMTRIANRALPPAKLVKYAMATVGPVGSAVAQFALSLVLLHRIGAAEFGAFSFLLVTSQLSWGVWSALFCAPLPILMVAKTGDSRNRLFACLLATSLAGALALGVAFMMLGIALGIGAAAAATFGVYAACALIRWYARAQAYARGAAIRTVASDIAYSISLLIGVGLIFFFENATLEAAYWVLLLSAAIGLVPFGKEFLSEQFFKVSARSIKNYPEIWRQHSGWSLLGVLTTEATANAHVYIVTFFYGPSAFAPLAASALVIRPINVTMNALTEFERVQMANQIAEGQIDSALAAAQIFRVSLCAALLVNIVAILLIFRIAPRLIFPPRYDLHTLAIAAALWIGVSAVRVLRAPEGVLMQAAGEFRALATASVLSCIGSVAGVGFLLFAAGPLWSIAGILFGELLVAIWIWKLTRRWAAAQVNVRTGVLDR